MLLFLIVIMLLISCGGKGQLPTDNITWGQAFNHVSESYGYWVFVIIGAILALGVGFKLYTGYKKGNLSGMQVTLWGFGVLAFNLCAWLIRVSEVAANTTVEQAARGVFIGY